MNDFILYFHKFADNDMTEKLILKLFIVTFGAFKYHSFSPMGRFQLELSQQVVITTKGLQDRNNNYLMEGRWKIKVN